MNDLEFLLYLVYFRSFDNRQSPCTLPCILGEGCSSLAGMASTSGPFASSISTSFRILLCVLSCLATPRLTIVF